MKNAWWAMIKLRWFQKTHQYLTATEILMRNDVANWLVRSRMRKATRAFIRDLRAGLKKRRGW